MISLCQITHTLAPNHTHFLNTHTHTHTHTHNTKQSPTVTLSCVLSLGGTHTHTHTHSHTHMPKVPYVCISLGNPNRICSLTPSRWSGLPSLAFSTPNLTNLAFFLNGWPRNFWKIYLVVGLFLNSLGLFNGWPFFG